VTKASSEAQASSRIIAAEALAGVSPFDLGELARGSIIPERRLTSRDVSNETARAAYALGRRRGFEQGGRAGLAQGRAESADALAGERAARAGSTTAELARLVECFRAEMANLESQVASDLVSLAIDIAREVLRREPATAESMLLPAVQEALRALSEGASQVEVQVHPRDAAQLAERMPQGGAGLFALREDPTLPPGSCRVIADTGIADVSFETRWHAVMATLGRDEEPLP